MHSEVHVLHSDQAVQRPPARRNTQRTQTTQTTQRTHQDGDEETHNTTTRRMEKKKKHYSIYYIACSTHIYCDFCACGLHGASNLHILCARKVNKFRALWQAGNTKLNNCSIKTVFALLLFAIYLRMYRVCLQCEKKKKEKGRR